MPSNSELTKQLEEATARINFLETILLGRGSRKALDVSDRVHGNVVFVIVDRPTSEIGGVFVDEDKARSIAARLEADVEPWVVQLDEEPTGLEGDATLRYFVGQRVRFRSKEGISGTGEIVWSDDDASLGNDRICYKIMRDGFTSPFDAIIIIYGLEIEQIVR